MRPTTSTSAPGLTTHDRIVAGRLQAFAKAPYYRQAVLTLVVQPSEEVRTMATTETAVMYYRPAFVDGLTVEECCSALLHESLHLFLGHFSRCRTLSAEPELWNTAGDLAINCILRDMGCAIGAGWLLPEHFRDTAGAPFPPNLLTEEYYELLQKGGKGKKGRSPKPGAGGGEGEGAASGDGEPGEGGGSSPAPGKPGDGTRQVCAGGCGGCAGNQQPGEPKPEQQAADGGRGEAEVERMRRSVAESIQKAAAGKRAGTIPAGLARAAEGILTPPKVSWQNRLAAVVRGAVTYTQGMVDYTHSRPSRRQSAVGGYTSGAPLLPAMHRPVPRVLVALDTSGSMGQEELTAALGELGGIVKAVGGEVEFLTCDTRVHSFGRVRTAREAIKLLRGGGGTDFHPIFRRASALRPMPNVVVVATDGYGPAPAAPPAFKTIWLLVGEHTTRPATWGECVEVK